MGVSADLVYHRLNTGDWVQQEFIFVNYQTSEL